MATVKIKGGSSGEISLTVPGVAGTNTLTLPASTGNAIVDDGSGNVNVSGTLNAATIEDSGWHAVGGTGEPGFQNSWVNFSATFGDARFRKINGIVQMEGLVKNGTANNIFTLPVGYRPYARIIKCTITNPNTYGRLDIASNGTVVRVAGSASWFSIFARFVASN